MGLIYLDSCIVVYALEPSSAFHDAVVRKITASPTAEFATSHLVMAECLVGPIRIGNSFLIQEYESFFRRLQLFELNEAIFRQGAQLVASNRLKMPDALHLACAQYHGCDALWTNDHRMSQASGGLAISVAT
ncbi:type II toxin-antitoxin system VapC family toxin [Candidatus Phycosocius spiralis]|uniref:Ribonuclease VapC n=1 Tax=Candidatus Phycosocius spiralis TaxID=2815099 RepID=A0ABQ4PXX8_9PROT|nr:type II toxin-antitoxin system VapC family toxin [Candidatus Phycosocius spiralis]GIU67934.1 hypothetical protein PsB1_2088 [Candidatus Phycosocius spiralis]